MNPSRILPDLQCSLLCEEVRQEMNGNFLLIGVFSALRLPQLPLTLNLCLFNRWTAGYGQFIESVRLLAPDQTTVLRKGEITFALQDVTHNRTTVSFWGQVKFETPGAYNVEVLVDDVMKLRYPVPLIVGPANPNPQPPAQKPAF